MIFIFLLRWDIKVYPCIKNGRKKRDFYTIYNPQIKPKPRGKIPGGMVPCGTLKYGLCRVKLVLRARRAPSVACGASSLPREP